MLYFHTNKNIKEHTKLHLIIVDRQRVWYWLLFWIAYKFMGVCTILEWVQLYGVFVRCKKPNNWGTHRRDERREVFFIQSVFYRTQQSSIER
jgi:hypothetical protein